MNNTMAKDLHKLFTNKGFNPIIGTIYQQQQYWLDWYRGDVDGFHNITKKNVDGINISIQKPSLQMAKQVSQDVASLLFNENVEIIVNDANAQKVLDKVLEDNNFIDEMMNFTELTCVYGTGVIVEYMVENETKLNFLFGDKVIVIDYDNTTIKAIALIQEFERDQNKYTHVMYHTFNKGKYRITHEMYANKTGKGLGNATSLGVLFNDAELNKMRHVRKEGETEIVEYYLEYDSSPHFQVFKLAISNNYDPKSPMGISLYANSSGTLENIDEKYYSSRMDSINSRKRIFIDDEASKVHRVKNEDGTITHRKYFDPDETQYQVLKDMGAQSEKTMEAFAPVYDSLQHDQAIQAELNYLSSKCLLGNNYYSYKDGAVGYQNELHLTLSNSPLRRNRNKNIKKLRQVLIGMARAILYLELKREDYEIDVKFDDDILTDDKTRLEQLRLDAQDGFIPEYMYVMEAYKVSKEEALELLSEADDFLENEDSVTTPLNNDAPPTEEEDGEE